MKNGATRWILAGLAAALVLWLAGRSVGLWVREFADWVEQLGALGPVAFVITYALATILFIPASLLTVTAGVLFGVIYGTVYAFLGATLGAAGAFLVSRHLARRAVKKRMGRDPRFARMDRAINRNGLQVVFLLRLSPVLPLSVVSYALGLTRVRFADYLLASFGLIPPTWMYVYNGKLVGDVVERGLGRLVAGGPSNYLVLGVGLLATLAVTFWLARVARRALR
jgi:uncharacterized membrane protein YdjX (TVP38/TMEM64 family)